MPKKPKPKTHPQGSICHDCAVKEGAIISDPMIVTCWQDKCVICQKRKTCCSTSDYGWPDGTPRVFD